MRTFKQGSYLIRDDISGRIVFNDEAGETWDGQIREQRHVGEDAWRHPQDFIRAKADPYPVSPIRPRGPTATIDFTDNNFVQGVTLPLGAASHLFPSSTFNGIGRMRIMKDGTTRVSAMSCATAFIVR